MGAQERASGVAGEKGCGMRKAIFWDFDGTLTDGQPTWRRCLVLALGESASKYGVIEDKLRPFLANGFPWHPDGDQTLTGEAFWECLTAKFAEAYEAQGVPSLLAAEAAGRVREVVQDERLYRVRPEAPGALMACAFKGYKNYILTNNFPEWEGLLDRLKLRHYFAGVVNSDMVGVAKPDARIFRKAEEAANFPARIWMVGDNPVADIQGAKNAGWGAIHITKPGHPHSGADYTVQSLEEIPKIL